MKVRLSVLKEYLSVVLVEGRVDDAREKYPDMDDEAFEYLVANQPAGSNNKYLMWACKQADELLEHDPDPQGLRIVIQAIRLFDGNKQRLEKKDLNQYQDTTEVEEAIAKLGASKGQQAKEAKANSDLIYNDDQFTVIRPHTAEASCKYGVGTRWCIAATASTNYFNSYSESNNKFYFVIDKHAQGNEPTAKFAIVIQDPINEESERRIQVFNAPDHQVGLQAVIRHVGDKWPAMWAKIKEHVLAQPLTREVEESRRDVKEHVKNLLKGDKVSNKGLQKIASDAELTTPVMNALVKRMREYNGPRDYYSDPRNNIVSDLARRASQMTPEGALELVKFIPTLKPEGGGYWYGRHHLETLMKNAPLTPAAFRELAQTADDEVLIYIIENPNCPADIVETMAQRLPNLTEKSLKTKIYRALLKRGDITPEQMRDAMSPEFSLSNQVLYNTELSANLSPELLAMVPVTNGDELKRFLALPNVPPSLAADLISKYWSKLKTSELYEMLKTVNLPTEMIERIWADKNQNIRVALLQNPAIGVANATKFASSRNNAYRFAVAHNTVLPPESLQALASDESASTRAAVAANPSTPTETLKNLAKDEAVIVRAGIASNAKTPVNVLKALTKDSDDFVRRAVRKTLKTLETTETFIALAMGMHGHLLKEELEDEDMQDIMTPDWRQIPEGSITLPEFIAIVLLQNNGSATREEIEEAFMAWPGHPQYIRVGGSYRGYRRRRRYYNGTGRRPIQANDIWTLIRREEQGQPDDVPKARGISAQGRGWFWSPAGINKGALYRLSATGAAAAMEALRRLRAQYAGRAFTARPEAPVKKSPPPAELTGTRPERSAEPGAPRGPKTTYKIYGKFKGHPVATRLKGQAYVGPRDTRFAPGEQAVLTKTDDGKLNVKKPDSDHTQTWEPIDG